MCVSASLNISDEEHLEKSLSARPDQCHPFFAHFRYHGIDHRFNSRMENLHPVQQWLFRGRRCHAGNRVSGRIWDAQPDRQCQAAKQPAGGQFHGRRIRAVGERNFKR